MIPEVVLTAEGFPADITGEGSFVRVCPLVDEQIVGFGKLASTELTDVFLLYPGNVQQMVNIRIQFRTM